MYGAVAFHCFRSAWSSDPYEIGPDLASGLCSQLCLAAPSLTSSSVCFLGNRPTRNVDYQQYTGEERISIPKAGYGTEKMVCVCVRAQVWAGRSRACGFARGTILTWQAYCRKRPRTVRMRSKITRRRASTAQQTTISQRLLVRKHVRPNEREPLEGICTAAQGVYQASLIPAPHSICGMTACSNPMVAACTSRP
jgi:hypothetical protein